MTARPKGAMPLSHVVLARFVLAIWGTNSRGLIELIDCRRIAISTNGNLHGHPDPQSLARFIISVSGMKHLYFNYDTDRTRPWREPEAKRKYGYATHYPIDTSGVIEIDLMKDE